MSETERFRAAEIVREADRVLNQERIRWFQPNKAQRRYIEAVGAEDSYIVIFAAGNGVGKTAATMAMLAALIWPEMAPECFGGQIFKAWPYPKDVRIVGTPQNIGDGGSIQREIQAWFPQNMYEGRKASKPYLSQYLANDWTINLMSFDQDISAFESATAGAIIFDEPCPKPIYNASVARMRRGGRILFPNTPLMDAAWVMDELVSKADGKAIKLVHGDIEENLIENGGILNKVDVDRMLSVYDPDELEARKSGKFMHLSGRIFKGFDRSVHVAKQDIVPPMLARDGQPVGWYMACDPAIGKPLAVVWAYVDAAGVVRIYDEWPENQFEGSRDSNLTVADYSRIFRERECGRDFTRILDRHFGNVRRTMGGISLRDEFAQQGIIFQDSYQTADIASEVETGIAIVKGFLRYDTSKAIDGLNRPKLEISPKCINTIASLERWSRDPKTGKPKEYCKDHADCVRYLLAANPGVSIPDGNWNDADTPTYGVRS